MADWLPVVRHEWHGQYHAVKTFYMRLGHAYASVFAAKVDGREAVRGEGCDVVTRLGSWEFKASNNTANSAGHAHDTDRAPGRCVCVTGKPPPGWISAVEFLALHGVEDPWAVAVAAQAETLRRVRALGQQLELPTA